MCGKQVITTGEQGTDRGLRGAFEVDDTEVSQRGFGEDNAGDRKHATGDECTHRVRENVLEHQTRVRCAERSRREDIFLLFEAVELHTGAGSHTDPAR